MWHRCSLILIALLCTAQVTANENSKQGIDVIGKGALLIEPDVFTFSVTLADRSHNAKQSKLIVDERAQQLVEMATSIGVNNSDIETARMQIHPIYSNKPNKDDVNQPIAIEVSRVIRFILDDFSYYDPLLDQAISLNARYISPLQYETSKADSYYRQALDIAVKDATSKAKQLAKQLKVTLKQVTYMTEMPSHAPRRLMRSDAAVAEAQSFSANPGRSEVTAQVMINFAIE